MPVFREQRDAAADALASFMRGEIGRPKLLEELETIGKTAGMLPDGDDLQKDVDLYLQEVLFIRAPRACQRIVQKDHWEELKRHLVFLKTDLCLPSQAALLDRQIILARWFLLTVLVVAAMSWLLIPAYMLSALMILPVVFLCIDPQHAGLQLRINDFTLVDATKYQPFANRRAWLSHQALLEPFQLPEIRVRITPDPPQQSLVSRIFIIVIVLTTATMATMAIIVTLLLAGIQLFLAWPCSLFITAFERRPNRITD